MRYATWHRMHLKNYLFTIEMCPVLLLFWGGSQMNNGTASFVIPYDAEGNGSLYSVKRQEMSHSITCLGMRERAKNIKRTDERGIYLP
jgi:hypothetical protein